MKFTNIRRTGGITFGLTAVDYVFSAPQGTVVATLFDPFVGQNLGTTTYALFGTTPPTQIALSGNRVVVGSTSSVEGTTYQLRIKAVSGDGLRKIGMTFAFKARASVPDITNTNGDSTLLGTQVIGFEAAFLAIDARLIALEGVSQAAPDISNTNGDSALLGTQVTDFASAATAIDMRLTAAAV